MNGLSHALSIGAQTTTLYKRWTMLDHHTTLVVQDFQVGSRFVRLCERDLVTIACCGATDYHFSITNQYGTSVPG